MKEAAKEIIAQLKNEKPLKIANTNAQFSLETDASDFSFGQFLNRRILL